MRQIGRSGQGARRENSLNRLDADIGVVTVELTLGDLRDIESAAEKIAVQGARYPEKAGATDQPLKKTKIEIWKLNEVAHSLPAKDRLIGLPARCESTRCFK